MYLTEHKDYSQLKVLLPLSGGINSAAVLCELADAPTEFDPLELHLFYSHLSEHSEDTFKFVADLIRFARKRFSNVFVRIIRGSVLKFFEAENFIPHPTKSPCAQHLKIEPMEQYSNEHDIDVDLIGWVREEFKRRYERAQKYNPDVPMLIQIKSQKQYPIKEIQNEQCFEIVRAKIGWYPAVYDIRDEKGNRVFTHNNCFPCKSMTEKQHRDTATHFPKKHDKAMQLSQRLGLKWGRTGENICRVCEF